MATNARQYVDPPTRERLPYGLFSVVEERPVTDPHVLAGVTWQSLCPSGGLTYDSCLTSSPSASGTPESKSANVNRPVRGATPFSVYTEVDCSPVDFYNRSDQIAMQSLLDVEDYQVEKAFWTGTAAVGNAVLPHLAANAAQTDAFSQSTITLQIAATTVTGTAVNIVDGLGMLEQALGQCFVGAGIIHVPPNALPVLDALGLVYSDGSRLRTRRGNLVAVGSGYPTTSPAGVAAPFGQSWIYATGPMFMYRSAPKLVAAPKESFVRSTNLVKAIAERTYVLGFDCCLYAVLVYTKSIIATSTAG